MSGFRVVAIVAAYNEQDVIGQVIGDLIRQDVEVYLIDHASTDHTIDQARAHLGRGLVKIERYPAERVPDQEVNRFSWKAILHRKEQLSRELDAQWFLHQDADELRESPWDGVSLREAIRRVDATGYNAIDFKAFDFVPVDDHYQQGDDLRETFRYYRHSALHDRLRINCWKKNESVNLTSSGGHEARFDDRRVFPVRFLLRHYPIRGQIHGERKVLAERKPRYLASERAEGWHIQYDTLGPGSSFISDREELLEFDLELVRTQLLAENRELEAARSEIARLKADSGQSSDLAWFRREWPLQERELVRVQAALDASEMSRTKLQGSVEELRARAVELEGRIDQMQSHAASLQTQIEELYRSMSWRTTAPLRLALRRLRGY